MKSKILLFLFLGILNLQAQAVKKPVSKTKATVKKAVITPKVDVNGIFATFETSKGKIVTQLEYKKTPITVANFISLVEGKNTFVTDEKLKGKPFFDGLKFHRVIADFMIQGGDPAGLGSGGPGYAFKDEFTDLKFDKGGILAMANSGPGTNGSQFFITHKDTQWLNGHHTIFGHVTKGMEVVNKIAKDDVILKVTISRIGLEAKKFDAPKVFADYYSHKSEDDKKQALLNDQSRKKKIEDEALAKKEYTEKYGKVVSAKAAYIANEKASATTTSTGLMYKIIKKGTGIKPVDGTTVYIKYAGYFADGNLFDSNIEEVATQFGRFDAARAAQSGYSGQPVQAGKKEGMIPGFLEAFNLLNYDDEAIFYIPANLAYGDRGAGDFIPPNTTLIFEMEMKEKPTESK